MIVTHLNKFGSFLTQIHSQHIPRAIWYQFMCNVDWEMPITEKLNAWAMNVSQAYLEYYDASSLKMDAFTQWKSLLFNTQMETERTDEWIPVVSNACGLIKSPPATQAVGKPSKAINPKIKKPGMIQKRTKRNPYKKPNNDCLGLATPSKTSEAGLPAIWLRPRQSQVWSVQKYTNTSIRIFASWTLAQHWLIFNVRFGFTENPNAWQMKARTKQSSCQSKLLIGNLDLKHRDYQWKYPDSRI